MEPSRASSPEDAADAEASAAPEPEGDDVWPIEFASRWKALGREILGIGTTARRPLKELVGECAVLICVTAWFESYGNITHAAERLVSSRRFVRDRIAVWREENPRLLPRRPKKRLELELDSRLRRRPGGEPAVGGASPEGQEGGS